MRDILLSWHTVTRTNDPAYLVNGTVLSSAIFGLHSRYCVEEVRAVMRNGDEWDYSREYLVRDAAAIGDDDIKRGARPPVVGRMTDFDTLLGFVAKETFPGAILAAEGLPLDGSASDLGGIK